MADITPVPASSNLYSDAVTEKVRGGEALAALQAVYKKSSDQRWYKAQCDGTLEESKARGITLMPAPTAGDYLVILKKGGIDLGATLTVTTDYCVSATAGGIAPRADITSGKYLTRIGNSTAANRLQVDFEITETAVP